ncbi:MAG: helix-turn-helix domain-containing protein [Candidatus Bathyarchaeota archaeon]|nr:helix-turn-helix domain-containing protein [Candidatus Bathyarchaeota archaeon]
MTEEIKEEMKRLREEITNLKNQLHAAIGEKQEKRRGLHIDIEAPGHEYVEDMMQGIAEGIHGELEKTICIGPGGMRIIRRGRPWREEEEETVDFPKIAEAMSALGHEHRLKILHGLMNGGKYIHDLQQTLPEITTSTLSSHLNVLEESGLVVQEKVRGRYLITLPGRAAYKTARKIAKLLERRNEE